MSAPSATMGTMKEADSTYHAAQNDSGAISSDATTQDAARASLHEELDAYLASVRRDDCYRVVRPLGRAGTTDLVMFVGANGAELGPLVRKRIPLGDGLGVGYEELMRLQRAGRRFVHLPRLVDCYKSAHELTVVSEYVPGETLEELVRRAGGSYDLAARVTPALCDAVVELHGALDPPLIHRDLTPRNVVVGEGSSVTLIDLGIARRHRPDASSDTVHLGTRAYAPPEQFGFGQTDVRSDVYALGMLLWFCLTGIEPAGKLDTATLRAAGVSDALAEVIQTATAFDPDHRYPTARAFRVALVAALEKTSEPRTASPEHAPAPTSDGVESASGGAAASALRASVASSDVTPQQIGPTSRTAAVDASAAPHAVSVGLAADVSTPATRRRSERAGRVRNVVLLVLCVILAPALVNAVQHPTGSNVGKPIWYVAVIAFGFVYPACLGAAYLAADKRRLYRRVPSLASRTWRQDLKAYVLMLLLLFFVLLVCTAVIS
ncbi:protein kinase [Collinsella sp. An2]|uniref:serine/threonine protein kinase n=1 Tax=Collinsella sp. An2 TaxID=1965585 RepID=UPI00130266DF|nr:protein kinase [Collinsella sp. An2]